MPPVIDLHTHSNCSDGILTPEDLVSRASEAGVEVLALTDHDTLAGVARAQQAAESLGLTLISGVELSCEWSGVGIHVVGLGMDCRAPVLRAGLASQYQARQQRAQLIASRLEKRGLPDALAGAEAAAKGAVVGRPHFAAYMVQCGFVSSFNAAFRRYLGNGKPGDVKTFWPDLETAIRWINDSGGIAVLAHPARYRLTRQKLKRLVSAFVRAGGAGIEVISGHQETETTRQLADLAERFDLYASAGSDFHNPEIPWQRLGGFGTLPARCKQLPLYSDVA